MHNVKTIEYDDITTSFRPRRSQGGKQVGEDGRIKFELVGDEVILVCRAAEKADQGRYSITLKNPVGSDTAHVNLIVLDKPGAPEGPLEVSDITPESCKLAWKPPTVGECAVPCGCYAGVGTCTR